MTEASLLAYIDASDEPITLAEAWQDFADAYGWPMEDNPYA